MSGQAIVDEALLERRDLGTDEDVVRRVLAGELGLYEVIMRRHNRRLYRVARSIVRDDEEATDVMQDAYVRAYVHLDQFAGESAFATWLTRIAVHEALARLRRQKRNTSLDDELGHEDEVMSRNDRNPEQHAHDSELRVLLEQAVDALPPAFRTVFVLRAVEELSTAEVANALEIPEDTVKTRLHRARTMLQRALVERVEATSRDAFSFARPRCDRVVADVLRRIARPAQVS